MTKVNARKKVGGNNLLSPDSSEWEYPALSLFSDQSSKKNQKRDFKKNSKIIKKTLSDFGISVRVINASCSPSVTKYFLKIIKNVNLNDIFDLSSNIALALASPTGEVRIEAPIPGTSFVGIEVPNSFFENITLHQMLSSSAMQKANSKLAVALGIDSAGNHVVIDIAKLPHLLISGVAGSGKTMAINSFLNSILFRASPAEVKLILVDPKRVELTGYNGIPHLLTPVIVDPRKVTSALKWALVEMENRYKKLAEVEVKNINAYNKLAGFAAMSSIVIVIDELADVILFSPSEVEEAINRIAQMARVVGIHLIIATQQPPSSIFTDLIRINIPSRISFKSYSKNDSEVMLNVSGAEKLLEYGDMLYLPKGRFNPIRVQGTFVSDSETKKLSQLLRSQGQKLGYENKIDAKYKPGVIKDGSGGANGVDRDSYFTDAVRLFSEYDKASSSLIQKKLSVGYARAARILDQLYEAGLVGPHEGSKPREVIHVKVSEYLANLPSEE